MILVFNHLFFSLKYFYVALFIEAFSCVVHESLGKTWCKCNRAGERAILVACHHYAPAHGGLRCPLRGPQCCMEDVSWRWPAAEELYIYIHMHEAKCFGASEGRKVTAGYSEK